MLLAAIGDIHGNLPALEAVLAAIDDAGIHTIVNTGDCVVGHPWPNEVVALLRARRIPTVQGESDRLAARLERKRARIERETAPDQLASIRETHEALLSSNLEYLAGLPRVLTVEVDGISVCVCHGTPQSQSDSLRAGDELSAFRRIREAANTDIVICGRTHVSFSKLADNALFANPGSVGVSASGEAAAQYMTISTETEPWEARLYSVPYGAGSPL